MNELQKVEFEMLKEVVRICEELNLRYYLVCGSALGAAKYKGFIPWDDDMDIALPREDYRFFCEKAQQLLPPHLFLQNNDTDRYYTAIFSKIRNSNTTYIERSYSETDMNHGVYIDVFPLDGYPEDEGSAAMVEREKYRYNLMRLCCIKTERSKKALILGRLEQVFGFNKNPGRFVKRLEKCISAFGTETSRLWCNHGNWQGKLEYAPKEQYGEGVYTEFEGLRVRIPERYDEYLTQKYGDWRTDLPKEEQVGHHYYAVCDLERPFTDYIEHLKNGRIKVKKN